MAKGIRAAVANTVSVIEGTTADTLYAGTRAFKHADNVVDIDDLSDSQSPTRRFAVKPTGDRELAGENMQDSEPFEATAGIEVAILYQQNDKPYELRLLMAEDFDRLSKRLMLATLWDASNTGLRSRRVGGYDPELAAASGGTAKLTFTVTVQYAPVLT